MSATIVGPDGKSRCRWCGHEKVESKVESAKQCLSCAFFPF